MKIKKLMSVSALCLVGVLGIGLLTGCNDKEDEKTDETTDGTTTDDTESGPLSGLVFDNLFSMLNGFTFEGSIDIAYGDIEVGLEFNNGQAVIPLDMSNFSFDISKLAVGGDLTIVYDSYEITLGVTYLDSAVYVDYGEDSYWSEGVGDSVHFFMANSDIGDLISLFSSDDSDASSVDWEELFGLDLTNFQVMDLIYSLSDMTLTTSASGEPAFAVPLTSLGINDSLLIRTNNDSECAGLECTNLVLGEFTISIDLSLEAVTDLKVTTPEEISEYVDLACVNGIVNAVYDIMEYKYFHLTGELSVGAWYGSMGDTATIDTTVDMRIAEDGTFTMLIDCDIPIVSANFLIMDVGITDGGQLFRNVFTPAYSSTIFGQTIEHDASWSVGEVGTESRHTTVYYNSEDGNTYFHRTDIGEGHDYTDNESRADSPSASDYTVTASYNTYEQWGMLSGHEFGYSPFSYILDNMVGCGSMIAEALGGSGEDGSFDFGMTIPSSLNGLITGLSVETTEESETVVSLDLSLGSLFTGDASILDELSIVLTLTEGNTVSEIAVELPIDYSLGILGSATFIIGVDLTLDESSSKSLEGIANGNDPFAEFEAYIAAHTCTCEECGCEDGECDESCECCSDGCECYFIQDKIVEKLWLDEELKCSCGCESCILGQCTCQSMGVCTCGDSSCTCTTTNA